MPTLVKLTTAGESVTMQVKSCEKAPTGKYPGMLWTGNAGTRGIITIEIPLSSTERQLKRLELTPASVVGRTVVISRDANATDPSKPWWGINLADVGEGHDEDFGDGPVAMEETGAPPKQVAKAPPATPAVAPDPRPAAQVEHVITGYLQLVDRVAAHIQKQTGAAFLDYATAQPIAATIFITMQKQGMA